MKLRPGSRPEPDINLTSLIDVVLLLLVFFMVTTSFVRESELTIRLPEVAESADSVAEEDSILEITVSATGRYFVNNRALVDSRAETLKAAIVKLVPELDIDNVTITADADASHQSVVTAMDVAGKLGFVNISISTVAATGTRE